ncbi:tetratricopeptide repeat protein 38-like isoform X2 [Glandiceps talaboti]
MYQTRIDLQSTPCVTARHDEFQRLSVLGLSVKNCIALIGTGTSAWSNPELNNDIERMVQMAETSDVSPLEKLHIDAVEHLALGNTKRACDKWEESLLHYPTDSWAMRSYFIGQLCLGQSQAYRDKLASVIPQWKTTMSTNMYSYIKGLYAFSLQETNLFSEAEVEAMQALQLNPKEAWSIHTVEHIKEMQGKPDEGIAFVENRLDNCKKFGQYGHLVWHLALYYIEKGDYESAMTLYDDTLLKVLAEDDTVSINDAASLLYRLELEGVNVGERWQNVYDVILPHVEDQALVFNDMHYLMAAQCSKHKDVADRLIESIKTFVSDGDKTNEHIRIYNNIGLPMCQAFHAYDNGEYAIAVNLLNPIRYQVYEIGGSIAQRDIFNLFLIHAALKSTEMRHQLLARSLLQERKALRQRTPMTDRLLDQVLTI